MQTARIIPALLLRGEGLYKTTKFTKHSYVGDPINALKIFNEKEVDEIMVLDIDASKKNKQPNFNFIEKFASECFIPLSYGGGIKNLKDAEKLYRLGIEKLVVQTSILENSNFLFDLIREFGSSSVILSVDVKKNFFGRKQIFSHANKKNKYLSTLEAFLELANNASVGEVLLNNVDRDGTMLGQDLKLIEYVSKSLNAPLISLGGIGSVNDIKNAFASGANAVAAGAFFVYHGPHRAVLISYQNYESIFSES